MKKIAFNAGALLSPLTGIGQYVRHIALGLQQQLDWESEFFYDVFWSREVRDAPLALTTSLLPWVRQHVPFSYLLRRLVQHRRFVAHAKAERFDLYHEPNLLLLPFDGPTVLTVHDLSWIHHPEAHPAKRVRAMNQYFEPSLRRATRVLTDSDFVKRELMDTFGVPTENIQAVPLGAEDLFRPMAVDETRAALIPRQLTHGQYLLAVGTLEPRKNLDVALHAYMMLPAALRRRFPLVLAGMKGWHTGMLEQQMAPLVRAGEIRLLGYVPRAELAAIIAGAAALVYPSIYEGFGLPPLEAMRCGVPVIASNVSSIPEVVGRNGSGGGILIDPQDVEGFQQAMSMMLTTSDVRADLANKALACSKQFSWERTVTETMAAYRLACGKS